jgi:nucleotide-binding universal stress UspA family protein
MTPITRILVPIDLRAGSLEVANYAVSLAARLGSGLVFLHALDNGWPLEPAQRKIRPASTRNPAVTVSCFAKANR